MTTFFITEEAMGEEPREFKIVGETLPKPVMKAWRTLLLISQQAHELIQDGHIYPISYAMHGEEVSQCMTVYECIDGHWTPVFEVNSMVFEFSFVYNPDPECTTKISPYHVTCEIIYPLTSDHADGETLLTIANFPEWKEMLMSLQGVSQKLLL